MRRLSSGTISFVLRVAASIGVAQKLNLSSNIAFCLQKDYNQETLKRWHDLLEHVSIFKHVSLYVGDNATEYKLCYSAVL